MFEGLEKVVTDNLSENILKQFQNMGLTKASVAVHKKIA